MERFKLIAENLDVAPLLTRILANEPLWAEHTDRQHYPGSAHKETETIYLRWATDKSVWGGFYCLESEDHVQTINKLGRLECSDLTQEAVKLITRGVPSGTDVGRVILTRMKPGGKIAEHTDEGPYADKYERFHVCLQGESILTCDGVHRKMVPGELWWFNHKLPHRVTNSLWGDRLHLIIDLVAPEYRKLRGLTFQRERVVDLFDEARPLYEAHYKEIAHFQDIPLQVNEDGYRAMEEAGLLRVYTARDCGELVGYVVFKVGPNLRYMTSLQALQDILYVDKSRRGLLIGKGLIDHAYARLKAEGCQVVYQHAKAGPEVVAALKALKPRHDVGRFFEWTGHELIDLVYGKRLDK